MPANLLQWIGTVTLLHLPTPPHTSPHHIHISQPTHLPPLPPHSLPLHLSPSSHDFQSALPSTTRAQWSTGRGPGSVQSSPSQAAGWATLTPPTPGRGRGSTTSLGEPLDPLCLPLLSYLPAHREERVERSRDASGNQTTTRIITTSSKEYFYVSPDTTSWPQVNLCSHLLSVFPILSSSS